MAYSGSSVTMHNLVVTICIGFVWINFRKIRPWNCIKLLEIEDGCRHSGRRGRLAEQVIAGFGAVEVGSRNQASLQVGICRLRVDI